MVHRVPIVLIGVASLEGSREGLIGTTSLLELLGVLCCPPFQSQPAIRKWGQRKSHGEAVHRLL